MACKTQFKYNKTVYFALPRFSPEPQTGTKRQLEDDKSSEDIKPELPVKEVEPKEVEVEPKKTKLARKESPAKVANKSEKGTSHFTGRKFIFLCDQRWNKFYIYYFSRLIWAVWGSGLKVMSENSRMNWIELIRCKLTYFRSNRSSDRVSKLHE